VIVRSISERGSRTPAWLRRLLSCETVRHQSRPIWLLVLPLVLAVVAYARVLGGPFQFDDTVGIEQNVAVKSLATFLRETFWSQAIAGGRPVTNLTFALNYAVGGLETWNFHLTNVAIHLAVSVLVCAFTLRVARLAGAARAEWLAVAVAGVFALHPIQSEAVSYIVQRAEVLASGFYLAALLLLLAAERHGWSWRGAIAWGGAFTAFAFGLGAKEIALTLPAAYLLLAGAVEGTVEARRALTTWRRRLGLIAPFVFLAAIVAARTLRALEKSPSAGFSVPHISPLRYLLTEARVLIVYLRLLAVPIGQNIDWDFPLSRTLADPAVLASTIVLVLLGATALVLLVRGRAHPDEAGAAARIGGFGIAWFFLVLSVTSSFVPLADVVAEHRVYLASWGVFAAVAVALERAVARLSRNRRASAASFGAVLLLWGTLAVALHRRNAVWESREALWRDALAKSPDKPGVRLSLGFAYRVQGRYDEAVAQYLAGLELARGDAGMEVTLLRNLGAACAHAGRFDAAIAAYRNGLAKDPDDPDLLVNLAAALASKHEFAAAEPWVRRALAISPGHPTGWNTLSAIMLERGDPQSGLDAAERAIALDPDMAVAHFHRADASDRLGRGEDACAAWRRALALGLTPGLQAHAERNVESRCGR